MKEKTRLRIGIDGNEANLETRVGVNAYAYNLIREISDIKPSNVQISVFLREEPKPHMPKETADFKYIVIPGGGQWIIKKLTPALYRLKNEIDVFWSPSHYIPLVSPIKTACSIMDLGYIRFRKQFKVYDFMQLAIWTSYSIIFSKKIFSISESTKTEIIRYYPFAKNKITTTLLGFDTSASQIQKAKRNHQTLLKKYKINAPYYIFMSTLKPSKNLSGLIEAWVEFNKNYPKNILVIAGKKGWLYEEIFEKIRSLNISESVVFTDFVPEEDKLPLISGAKAFVLPSFWEGFGLDVLTAQASSVPVIASNVGSLPEVCGEAAVFCDPYDKQSIIASLEKVEKMGAKDKNKLIEMGLENTKRFSWNWAARTTLDKLLEIAKK